MCLSKIGVGKPVIHTQCSFIFGKVYRNFDQARAKLIG